MNSNTSIKNSIEQTGESFTITEALYSINKEAKKIRDEIQTISIIRNKVKAYLFDDADAGLTDEEYEILDKFGVKADDFSFDTSDEYNPFGDYDFVEQILNSYKDDLSGVTRTIHLSDVIEFERTMGLRERLNETLDNDMMELLTDDDGWLKIDYDTEKDTIQDIVKDKTIVESIVSEQEYGNAFIFGGLAF